MIRGTVRFNSSQIPPGRIRVDGLLQRYWLTMRGGRWASSARLTAHAALSNKSAMTTAWPRIS
jgi:hypothetical protein